MTDKSINDGGPAFPVSTIDGYTQDGMTLRDWLAGMALQGFLASHHEHQPTPASAAKWSYNYADAMLEARAAFFHAPDPLAGTPDGLAGEP